MINFKNKVIELLDDKISSLSAEEIEALIEVPPSYDMGDYAFPTFRLAKEYRKAPNAIAEEIASTMEENEFFGRVQNQGPYVNFFIDRNKLAEDVISDVMEKKEMYGSSEMGEGKKVIVEFSSPNIAKPFQIGHIRTTVIGNSLAKIYKFLGFDTVTINHLGDYGTQFGMLISAYKKWGDRKVIEANPISELLKLYVRFNTEAEDKPELQDEARYWFKELENKNAEAMELWQWIRDISLKVKNTKEN